MHKTSKLFFLALSLSFLPLKPITEIYILEKDHHKVILCGDWHSNFEPINQHLETLCVSLEECKHYLDTFERISCFVEVPVKYEQRGETIYNDAKKLAMLVDINDCEWSELSRYHAFNFIPMDIRKNFTINSISGFISELKLMYSNEESFNQTELDRILKEGFEQIDDTIETYMQAIDSVTNHIKIKNSEVYEKIRDQWYKEDRLFLETKNPQENLLNFILSVLPENNSKKILMLEAIKRKFFRNYFTHLFDAELLLLIDKEYQSAHEKKATVAIAGASHIKSVKEVLCEQGYKITFSKHPKNIQVFYTLMQSNPENFIEYLTEINEIIATLPISAFKHLQS